MALPGMQSDLGLTATQAGLLGSVFFWVYACGQLVNGSLGDRISPRLFVLIGLLGTAAVNLCFGLAFTWAIMLGLWALNGYFQAVGWGPTLRLLANWLAPAQRSRISVAFGTSFVAGNAVTWLFTGWLIAGWGWRSAFLVPALLLSGFGLLWWLAVRDGPPGFAKPVAVAEQQGKILFAGDRLRRHWPALLSALAAGFCYATLILWTPTYFVDAAGLGIVQASVLAALMPLAAIGGTLIAAWVAGRFAAGREVALTAAILLAAALIFLVMANVSGNLFVAAGTLILASSVVNAAASLVVSTWPLVLGATTISSMAGLMGFAFNIGGGLSVSLVGIVLDRLGWSALFIVLAVAALLAAVAAMAMNRRRSAADGAHTLS